MGAGTIAAPATARELELDPAAGKFFQFARELGQGAGPQVRGSWELERSGSKPLTIIKNYFIIKGEIFLF
jgi:hypothetical protein